MILARAVRCFPTMLSTQRCHSVCEYRLSWLRVGWQTVGPRPLAAWMHAACSMLDQPTDGAPSWKITRRYSSFTYCSVASDVTGSKQSGDNLSFRVLTYWTCQQTFLLLNALCCKLVDGADIWSLDVQVPCYISYLGLGSRT